MFFSMTQEACTCCVSIELEQDTFGGIQSRAPMFHTSVNMGTRHKLLMEQEGQLICGELT